MMRILLKYYLLLILTQSIVLFCATHSDLPTSSSGEIQFYLDDASFFNDGKVYQEFYLMIFTDQLKLVPRNNSLYADLLITATILNIKNHLIEEKSWETQVHVGLESDLIEKSIVSDQWGSILDLGIYFLELELKDKVSGKSGNVKTKFEVKLDVSEKLFLSDLQFVSDFKIDADGTGIFDKGGISTIPHASRRYGFLNPVLYFYFEIYNQSNEIDLFEYEITYEVINNMGVSIRSFNQKNISSYEKTIGLPKGLNVSALNSGIYTLQVIVKCSNGLSAKLNRQFEIIQMDYLEKDALSLLTEDQAEMFGEIIRLISSESDYQFYQNLSVSGKAKYLIEFWRRNDPHPFTTENELYDRIVDRYQYANKHFGWGKLPGWKTDRGKILIKYGMPENIQRFPFEESTSPYEIWEYQGRKNYIYVFGDLRSDGRYTLLHSTKEEEIYNPYWKEELNRM